MRYKTLLAAGGDKRQLAAAASLAEQFDVTVTGFPPDETLPPAVSLHRADEVPDVLLLPMPVTQDGIHLFTPLCPCAEIPLTDLTAQLRAGTPVLGGRMSPALCRTFAEDGLIPLDYAKNEAFAQRNAVPTAEGAIGIALRELPVTLHGLPVLLLGAGRLSRALWIRLRALGADVTVAARRCSDLARREGCKRKPVCNFVRLCNTVIKTCPIRDNTILTSAVPSCIMNITLLRRQKENRSVKKELHL